VFTRPSSGWTATNHQAAKLTASDGADYSELGFSVGISGSTVIAGAPYTRVQSHNDAGAAYLFVKPSGGWANSTESAELVEKSPATKTYLGDTVGVSGSTAAAGAPYQRVGRVKRAGIVEVFSRPSAGWARGTARRTSLVVRPAASDAYFGQGVGVSGRHVVASGYGLLSLFNEPTHGWAGTRQQNSQLTGAAPTDFLGPVVAIAGKTIVTGAAHQTVGTHLNQGALYIFRR
jgi:hypothetical protein